jgi:DNA replication protein DnaC
MESASSLVSDLTNATIAKAHSEGLKELCLQHGTALKIETVQAMGRTIQLSGTCPQCHEVTMERERQQEEKRQETLFRTAQREAGVPLRYQHACLDPFPVQAPGQENVLAEAKHFVETAGQASTGLIFIGKIGSGKTHVGCAILNTLLRAGKKGLFLTTVQAIRRIKETYSKDAEKTEQEALRGLFAPDILILDEVGVQRGTDTEHQIMLEIVNDRYSRMKPTILISNLPMPEFTLLVGDRIVDRFREGGKVLVFDWSSLRSRRQEK